MGKVHAQCTQGRSQMLMRYLIRYQVTVQVVKQAHASMYAWLELQSLPLLSTQPQGQIHLNCWHLPNAANHMQDRLLCPAVQLILTVAGDTALAAGTNLIQCPRSLPNICHIFCKHACTCQTASGHFPLQAYGSCYESKISCCKESAITGFGCRLQSMIQLLNS